MYKSGTVTRGRGHRDARQGTWGHHVWDAGTCRMGTQGRQKQGRRGRGMWMIIAKVGGKCDISFFVNMCYLWFHLPKPHWTPYDVYTQFFFIIGVSALTIVIIVTIYNLPLLFTWLKFTWVNMHSQKRVSGNQPLSTVSKHLLLGLPLKICRTK